MVTSESTDSGSITVITLQDESTSPVINGTSGDDNLLGDQYSNLIKGFRDINWLRDKAKEDI